MRMNTLTTTKITTTIRTIIMLKIIIPLRMTSHGFVCVAPVIILIVARATRENVVSPGLEIKEVEASKVEINLVMTEVVVVVEMEEEKLNPQLMDGIALAVDPKTFQTASIAIVKRVAWLVMAVAVVVVVVEHTMAMTIEPVILQEAIMIVGEITTTTTTLVMLVVMMDGVMVVVVGEVEVLRWLKIHGKLSLKPGLR